MSTEKPEQPQQPEPQPESTQQEPRDRPQSGQRSREQQESDEEAKTEGYIPDSQLPEDLQPEKNPLAADPEQSNAPDGEDDDEGGVSEPTA